MHVEDAASASAFVQVIDILGDDQKLARPLRIEPRQRPVGRVRLHLPQLLTPQVVEFLNQRRIARKGFGSGDILDPVSLPKAVGAAEGGKAALRGDAGAGEDEDVAYVGHVHTARLDEEPGLREEWIATEAKQSRAAHSFAKGISISTASTGNS